jgi:ClpP class serine protease
MGFPITPSGVLLRINCPGGLSPGAFAVYTAIGTFDPIVTAGVAPKGGC